LMHPERPGFVLLNEELRRIFGWSKHEPTSTPGERALPESLQSLSEL
jgi:hypothetical protein